MAEDQLDIEALRRLRDAIGGDQDGLAELIDDFIETAPDIVERLRAANTANDATAMRIAAHELKSNSRDFGAVRLGALAAELEANCRSGTDADQTVLVDRIAEEEQLARTALSMLSLSDV